MTDYLLIVTLALSYAGHAVNVRPAMFKGFATPAQCENYFAEMQQRLVMPDDVRLPVMEVTGHRCELRKK